MRCYLRSRKDIAVRDRYFSNPCQDPNCPPPDSLRLFYVSQHRGNQVKRYALCITLRATSGDWDASGFISARYSSTSRIPILLSGASGRHLLRNQDAECTDIGTLRDASQGGFRHPLALGKIKEPTTREDIGALPVVEPVARAVAEIVIWGGR